MEKSSLTPLILLYDKPLYKEGHLAILKGNLIPEGCVAKIAGLKNLVITEPARVFDIEPELMDAIMADKITHGDVVVLRYEGPKGPVCAKCWLPRQPSSAKAWVKQLAYSLMAVSLAAPVAWWLAMLHP
jgi:dihydroxyacid dehydratase/phosphogluconate dehydratase